MPEPADTVAAPQGARDLFDLSGRVAVVTGGTRGLGLAMATAFAQAGAEVVVVSRKADACRDVAARLRDAGWRATGHACHVVAGAGLTVLIAAGAYAAFRHRRPDRD